MKKKWISALLMLCMLMTLLPSAAFAVPEQSSATQMMDESKSWYKAQLDPVAECFYNALVALYETKHLQTGVGEVNLSEYGITAAQLQAYVHNGDATLLKAFQDGRDAFAQDYCDVFYVDFSKVSLRIGQTADQTYQAYLNSGANANYYARGYDSQETVQTILNEALNTKKAIKEKVNAEQAAAKTNLSREQIITIVHDALIELLDYGYPTAEHPYANGIGALGTSDHTANCVGYASSMKWILEDLGIPCILVSGVGQNSLGNQESHMWNYVQIEGQWYAVDAAWDDPVTLSRGATLRDTYLLRGSDTMNFNHFPMGLFSPGGRTFVYPELNPLDYRVYLQSASEDVDTDLKVSYTRQVDSEGDESTLYLITYQGLTLKQIEASGMHLAARFHYEKKGSFGPWVDLSAYSIDQNDPVMHLPITQAGSIQFCLTSLKQNGMSYAEDLSLPENHKLLSKPLQVPYSTDYQPAPHIRKAEPTLQRCIQPEKQHYRVEYGEKLLLADPTQPYGMEIKTTEDYLNYALENLSMEHSQYKTADGEIHESTILSFDFTPDKTYQAYINTYSLQPTNLVGIASQKAPKPIPIVSTYPMFLPCPSMVAQGVFSSAFVIAQPTLLVAEDMDIFEYDGGKSANALDIRLVASIPNGNKEEALLDALGEQEHTIFSSAVYDLSLSCVGTVAKLKQYAGLSNVTTTIGLPYPEGYNYHANSNVSFKAYHYRDNGDGTYTAEPLVCRITERGLEVIVKSFSPFAIVAVPKDNETEGSEKMISTAITAGSGKITTILGTGETATTISAVGLQVVETGATKAYNIEAADGYVIDQIILNGDNLKAADTTSQQSLSFTFAELEADNALKVSFVAKVVQQADQEKGLTILQPELTALQTVGTIAIDCTASTGKVILNAPDYQGEGSNFYYKTTRVSDLGQKPSYNDQINLKQWQSFNGVTEITGAADTEIFVQMVCTDQEGKIKAWGQTSKYPQETLGVIDPLLIAQERTIALGGFNETGAVFYYKTTAADDSNNQPVLNTQLNPQGWTQMTVGQGVSLPATVGRVLYVQVVKVNAAGQIKAWGQASATPTGTDSSGGHTGGSGGSGGSSITSSDSSAQVVAAPVGTAAPTVAQLPVAITVGSDGIAHATLSEKSIADGIAAAQQTAVSRGKAKDDIALQLLLDKANNMAGLAIELPKAVQEKLTAASVQEMQLKSELLTLSFNQQALQTLQNSAQGDFTIQAMPADGAALSTAASQAVGNRPIMDLSVLRADGKQISSLGKGTVTVEIPYTKKVDEQSTQICGVYMPETGAVQWLPYSYYNQTANTVQFRTSHFSVYGIGYMGQLPNFQDLQGHWGQSHISFAVARGLMSGTGEGNFSPDTEMTRAMFVTVLGKLSGAEIVKPTVASFQDVAADQYYFAYVEWAARNQIVSGTGEGQFSPNRPITREEMALIMARFAAATGVNLYPQQEKITFTDAASISKWASAAVGTMQTTGVLKGRADGGFAPQATATRAEAASLLSNYVAAVLR